MYLNFVFRKVYIFYFINFRLIESMVNFIKNKTKLNSKGETHYKPPIF